jgi:hypothetical protein
MKMRCHQGYFHASAYKKWNFGEVPRLSIRVRAELFLLRKYGATYVHRRVL